MHQLASDGILAVIAGFDTTSVVLSTLFYCLLCNPDIYERLQREVDHYYPPETSALDTKYYPEMSYLDAVMRVIRQHYREFDLLKVLFVATKH